MASGAVAVDIRRLTDPTEEQVEKALGVLMKSYEHDIAAQALSGNDPKVLLYIFQKLLSFALQTGHVYIAVSGSNIIGVALWIPPGVDSVWWLDPDLLEMVKPELQVWYTEHYTPLVKRLYKNAFPNVETKRRDSWWLKVLGVVPESQHKGIGKALISVIARRDEPMVAEARDPGIVDFLQKAGFKYSTVKNVSCVNSPGFPMFLMYKNPT